MLKENQIAPDFSVPIYPQGEFRLYDCNKIALIAFYKFSCGTCRFTFPFLQKIYRAYGDAFCFYAVAQDGPEKIEEFRRDLGITIPTAMDLEPYNAGRLYEIKSVPSLFLIDNDHVIRYAGEGFAKHEILNLADTLAEKFERPQIDVFENAEVPDFKPG